MENRLNPASYTRPVEPSETFVFRDADHEVESTWCLKKLSNIEMNAVAELANEMTEKYITGNPSGGVPPLPFPQTEQGPIELSRSLFLLIAQINKMHIPNEGCAPYAFEDFVMFAANMPSTFAQITDKAGELQGKKSTVPLRELSVTM